jgi:reactive chlorine resistance protein C
MSGQFPFQVAEQSTNRSLSLIRWALFVVFVWFGCMKFTAYEAAGISGFISNSPLMGWLITDFGVRGASYVIGVLELSTAAALLAGAVVPVMSAVGAAMSCCTYLVTLSFFFSTLGVAEPTAGGFPAISAVPGQFLLKDIVLLAASVVLLTNSLRMQERATIASALVTSRHESV